MEKTSNNEIRAICILENKEKGVKGTVKFTDNGTTCKITAEFTGLPEGLHGFHIHEFGDLSDGCMTAGPHYNPFGKTHGAPCDEIGGILDAVGFADGCRENKLDGRPGFRH